MFLKTKPNSVIVFEPTEPENDEPQFAKDGWSEPNVMNAMKSWFLVLSSL